MLMLKAVHPGVSVALFGDVVNIVTTICENEVGHSLYQ